MKYNILNAFDTAMHDARDNTKGLDALKAMHTSVKDILSLSRFSPSEVREEQERRYNLSRDDALKAGINVSMLPKNLRGRSFTA
ncbi:hypothetical protein HYZ97_04040 [Candidatus Pacearchaeota archaeon]|nr:hypothetical protein [Candidatus Pacearchaeota archaeon]